MPHLELIASAFDRDVDEVRDPAEDDEWDSWAHVHAALVDPDVVEALPGVIGVDDLDLLEAVRWRVAEPARSWLTELIDGVRVAA